MHGGSGKPTPWQANQPAIQASQRGLMMIWFLVFPGHDRDRRYLILILEVVSIVIPGPDPGIIHSSHRALLRPDFHLTCYPARSPIQRATLASP